MRWTLGVGVQVVCVGGASGAPNLLDLGSGHRASVRALARACAYHFWFKGRLRGGSPDTQNTESLPPWAPKDAYTHCARQCRY